jgi:segregation and condensation protein B
MDRKELESALEAILFASGEPVQVDRICVALDIDRPTVEQLLQKLMDYYAYERRGIRLLKKRPETTGRDDMIMAFPR